MAKANNKVATTSEQPIKAETNKKVAMTPEQSTHRAELKRRALVAQYKSEETIPVNIAPMYKPYFGASMIVTVNGISVVIPCDGRTHHVPKTHAVEALARLYKVNLIVTRKDRMKNVSNNVESTPGELQFF